MSVEGLQQSKDALVTVVHSVHEWTAPDDPSLKRWKLIIEKGPDLLYAYTYNPALAKPGTYRVAFYGDTSRRQCIRKPTGGQDANI